MPKTGSMAMFGLTYWVQSTPAAQLSPAKPTAEPPLNASVLKPFISSNLSH